MKYTPGTDLDAVRKQFLADVAGHSLTVLHDDGYYRHLDLRRDDGSSESWFEILTSPGTLTIRGDAGTYVFARLEDMFSFFGDDVGRVNPTYWGEKVLAEPVSGPVNDSPPDVVRGLVSARFLWALCAIPWAIRLYRGVKEGSVTLMVRPEQLEAFAECRSPVVDADDPEQTATPCGACSSCDLAAAISARKKFLAAAESEEEAPI